MRRTSGPARAEGRHHGADHHDRRLGARLSHGVIDPIAEMGQIAQAHDIHLHVDACVGGYQIPFIRRLGYPATNFDFTLPGVSSIAADLHKFGYSAQGSAVLVYRDAATHPIRDSAIPDGRWVRGATMRC